MRKTTKQKYYGRSAAASALHTAIANLELAVKESKKPQRTPLSDALREVAASLNRAAKSFEVYNLKRKRLQWQLGKEMQHIEALLQEVQGIPVTQDEKLTAKVNRKKGKK